LPVDNFNGREGTMIWLKRLRGALGIGLCWGLIWALIGGFLMEGILDRNGEIVDTWPQVLGIVGFLGGVIFSGVIALVAGLRRFPDFSFAQFAGLGAVAGLLQGVAAMLAVGAPLPFLGVTTVASALMATGTLAAVRLVGAKQLGAGEDPRRLSTLALLVLLPGAVHGQAPGAVLQQLDSIAAAQVSANRAVGLVAIVVQGDETVLRKAYGKADADWDVPMPPDAIFEIGSITKQFTAVAILKLRDAGKLSLDDDITKWLPDLDTRGHKVSLRHLLNHTSGFHDFTETAEFPALVSNRVWPRDSAYALIKRQPFDFSPGARQTYSNSGFWLLGLVIEKASGASYEDYLEQQLFAPLGMTRSSYCTWHETLPRRAHGHGMENGKVYRGPTNIHTWSFAAGAVCSTADDLVTWLRALHGGKVLSAASYAELVAPSRMPNGMPLRYGFGLGVERDPMGRLVYNHGGINAGFRSEALWYPETNTGIVVLMNNTGGVDPEVPAREMARALLPGTAPGTAKFPSDVTPLLGRYRGATLRGEMTVEVTQGDQGLMVSGNGSTPRPLVWIRDRTFFSGNIYVEFGPAEGRDPVTEVGISPAKGAFFVMPRVP
jgi:CubicO group peptidase (beta-lactamase class C family)